MILLIDIMRSLAMPERNKKVLAKMLSAVTAGFPSTLNLEYIKIVERIGIIRPNKKVMPATIAVFRNAGSPVFIVVLLVFNFHSLYEIFSYAKYYMLCPIVITTFPRA